MKKEGIFYTFILSEGNFFDTCFITMYSVLNTLSEYTYLYISNNITAHFNITLLAFKIVESLLCILNTTQLH